MNKVERAFRLLPNGIPRYIRIYDNGGESFDRYTVLFTGRWKGRKAYHSYFRGMSENPYSPRGYGIWEDRPGHIDRPSYAHLGKRIAFATLPEPCKRSVLSDYREIWGLD